MSDVMVGRVEFGILEQAREFSRAALGAHRALAAKDARIAELEAENAELRKARLDWFDALPCAVTVHRDHPKADSMPTLREWIDAAMERKG
jgi:hypothetical protein